MDELLLQSLDPSNELVQVQDEPALDIALPQVFTQPELTVLRRGKVPHIEWLVARLYRTYMDQHGGTPPGTLNGQVQTLGPDYQTLADEFQPLFAWGTACWDYLLSTEGCRFVLRHGDEKLYCRGDYRAVTDRDYSRLLHRVFRQCLLAFAQTDMTESLAAYLRGHFWDAVLGEYQRMDAPPDPSQRKLTAYSYLRCVPYQFLNTYHDELVSRTFRDLPAGEQDALSWYFLRFKTLDATAGELRLPAESTEAILRRCLTTLLVQHRLVYCLLRQIERY